MTAHVMEQVVCVSTVIQPAVEIVGYVCSRGVTIPVFLTEPSRYRHFWVVTEVDRGA